MTAAGPREPRAPPRAASGSQTEKTKARRESFNAPQEQGALREDYSHGYFFSHRAAVRPSPAGDRTDGQMKFLEDDCLRLADPQTGVASGWTRGRHLRSRCRCSMCSAIHINSRSWLRSSSTHEPSDPPLKVVFQLLLFETGLRFATHDPRKHTILFFSEANKREKTEGGSATSLPTSLSLAACRRSSRTHTAERSV